MITEMIGYPWDTGSYSPQRHREFTRADLLEKFSREDWHGVADAAMDLRDIDAFIAGRAGAEHP